ncbi:MAG: restriction endonuclease subunit S [Cyanobacteriota bacterium]
MKNSAFISSKPETNATKEEAWSALVPRLRFPEFRDTEAWEQKEVGDLFQVARGDVLSMKLVHNEKTEAMPYPVYSSQTKNNGLSGFYSKYLFEDAITWTPDGANAGDVNYRPGKFFCTNVCGVLLCSKGFANPCIAARISSVARKYVSYVGNPKLMNGIMGKIPIPLSPIREQQKIAECVCSEDELIAAQARKVEALKTDKKGLMQQLFPREGETQPRLRFPEFQNSGEWSKESLDNLLHFQDGFAFKSTDFVKENHDATQVIRITDINNKNTNADKVYIPTAFLEQNKLVKYRIDDGDLLLSLTGAAGFNFFFWNGGPAVINQWTAKVTVKKKSVHALLRLLEPLIHEKINERGEGQNNNLSKEFLSTISLRVPESEEQQRIASCLSNLDALITAETQKLAALKTHKKGLMQQLFPSTGVDEL